MSRALWLVLPLALSSVACTYDNGGARRVVDSDAGSGGNDNGGNGGNGAQDTQCGVQAKATIDVDETIDPGKPGEGAGVFVEYLSGGHWRVTASCDTLKNDVPCRWDLIATAEDGTSISNVKAVDLESNDSLLQYDAQSYQFKVVTNADFDGFTFDTPPGAAVMFDTLLDDSCSLSAPLFFWIGSGAVHPGAPSNPLVLIPSGD